MFSDEEKNYTQSKLSVIIFCHLHNNNVGFISSAISRCIK